MKAKGVGGGHFTKVGIDCLDAFYREWKDDIFDIFEKARMKKNLLLAQKVRQFLKYFLCKFLLNSLKSLHNLGLSHGQLILIYNSVAEL